MRVGENLSYQGETFTDWIWCTCNRYRNYPDPIACHIKIRVFCTFVLFFKKKFAFHKSCDTENFCRSELKFSHPHFLMYSLLFISTHMRFGKKSHFRPTLVLKWCFQSGNITRPRARIEYQISTPSHRPFRELRMSICLFDYQHMKTRVTVLIWMASGRG